MNRCIILVSLVVIVPLVGTRRVSHGDHGDLHKDHWTYVGSSLVDFVSSLCPWWEPGEFPTKTTLIYTKTTGLM